MPVAPGSLIGPYQIVGWLGSGGMGEVYRARDPRLGREVAIKLLPERFASDASRLLRFEREARAAGQLNHPAILTVHDIGRHGGAPFVVAELLEGETLRVRLRRGPLPPRKAVEYARQVVEGLAIAHDKGIVHRDVKPENVFITTDERVKILDFGIAKLTQPDIDRELAPDSETVTNAGMVVGSSGYMSPEQVRGDRVDERSDIFNVGTILYEMVSGRAPFSHATPAEITAAILKDEPAPLEAPVNATLARIIARCLAKNRDARFQSARDLAFVLSQPAAATTGWSRGRVKWRAGRVAGVAAAGAMAILALALPARWSGAPTGSMEDLFGEARFTRFTDWEGTEGQAEISDDGRFVAFIADRSGPFDVWMSEVGTGQFDNLTEARVKLAAPGPPMRLLQFTPDASRLWMGGAPGPQSHVLSLVDREMRAFLPVQSTGAAWSPDGTRLSFITVSDGDPLLVADASGAGAMRIFGREEAGVHTHNPVWSPDGEWIYFVHGRAVGGSFEMDIWRVHPSGDAPEQLTELKTAIDFLAFVDNRTLLYVARSADRSGQWLWALDIPSRTTRRLVSGRDQFRSVSASRDGRRIVATVALPTTSLAAVSLGDRVAEEGDIRAYGSAAPARMPRFGRRSFFYVSAGGGSESLWRVNDGRAQEIWKGAEGTLTEPPAISRDEARIAVVLHEVGNRRLWTMASDGTDRRVLAPAFVPEGPAEWSPDGAWLVAGGTLADVVGLYRIPLDGGEPIRIAEGASVNPAWSPDGEVIVYNGPIVAGTSNLLAVRPDGTPVPGPPVRVRPGGQRFLRSGRGLIYQASALDFHLLDLATGQSRQLTKFQSSAPLMAARTFDVTPDDGQLVFDRTRDNSDILLIELPR